MYIRLFSTCAFLLASVAASGTIFKAEGACVSGVPDGPYVLYSGNSVTRALGTFSRGKKNGPFIFFRSSGEPIGLIPFRMDQIDGVVRLWYGPEWHAGQLKQEATYAEGKLDGPKISWYPDGSRRSAFYYRADKLERAQAWKRDGSPISNDEAVRLASHDHEADERLFDTLLKGINENLPECTTHTKE